MLVFVGFGVFDGIGVWVGVKVWVGGRVSVGGSVRVAVGKTVGKLTATAVGSGVGVEEHAVRINTNNVIPITPANLFVSLNLIETFCIMFDPLIDNSVALIKEDSYA